MSQTLTESFRAALASGQPFFPIHISSLRLDTVTNFDLYLRVRPDEPHVLYAKRDVPFTDAARNRLLDNRIDCLYISSHQENEYRRYLESHLKDLVSDSSIPPLEKSEILYMSAQGLVKSVLEQPELEDGIERTQQVVGSTVDFLLSQRSALRYMVETASRDYLTYTHAVNGCVYSVALAQRSGLAHSGMLNDFGSGVLLRDLGMSQLDESIAEGEGELTLLQYEIMKQHPVLGEQLLREIGGLSDAALQIVRHHHEKLNGTGYPDGLRGDEITPLMRICTISDVFDALTTNRPYRKALTSYEALKLMGTEMRDEIDPELFKAFVNMMGNPD